MIVTGLSRKMEIKEIDDNSAYTSQLTNLKGGQGSKREPPRRKVKRDVYSDSGKLRPKMGSVPVSNPISQTDSRKAYDVARSETTLLSESPDEIIGTTVLSHDGGEMETSILTGGSGYQSISPEQFCFRLEREILLVHTDEEIA